MTRNVRTVLSIRDVQGRNTKEARTEFFIFNLNKIAYHKMVVNHYWTNYLKAFKYSLKKRGAHTCIHNAGHQEKTYSVPYHHAIFHCVIFLQIIQHFFNSFFLQSVYKCPNTVLNALHALWHWSFTRTLEVAIIIILLRMSKLKLRKVKQLAQGNTIGCRTRIYKPVNKYSNAK